MSIPESRVEAILSNILGEDYEVKLGKSRVEDLLIALGSYVANTPQLDNDGLIPISYIPKDAFQDCVTVADDTARFALTTDDVQNGDCVYVNSSQIMYFVVDDTKLDLVAGYKALAAGMAVQAVADKDGNQIDTTYATKNELAGKQDIIDSAHKLNADLVDDSNSTNKFTSANEKSTWNGKQDAIDSSHKLNADLVDDSNSTNKFNVQANWTESSSAAASFIQNKPTLGTASALDVASSGDASTTEVVKGDDTRVLAVTAQQNTTATGGNGYAIINGIRLYANPSGTPPTGDIPDGSYGLF